MRTGIRFKSILTIFPVILASLTFIGANSIFNARTGMIRLALEALSFKAEILKQYADSQWGILVSQGFSEDEEFHNAVSASIANYAKSLGRNDSERITALNLDGAFILDTFQGKEAMQDGQTANKDLLEKMHLGNTGPIIFGKGKEERYGQAFYFKPLGWYVVVSDSAEAIFTETDKLSLTILWGFGVSLLLSLGLLIILTGSIVKPIVRVSKGMTEIIRTNTFDTSIPVTGNDEVGVLTMHFNTLCKELNRSYNRIKDIALREVQARHEIADRELQAIIALGKVAEFRDEDTSAHTIRVGFYSRILANIFFEDEEDRRSIFFAAPMHDLGKIGIPDAILFKTASLTPDEYMIMQNHTTIGHTILSEFKNPALAMGSIIALNHHERFDGKGYPRGLRGADIPLCGRILAIVDVFDAMTSERPYKKAWHTDKAFEYIQEERGGHFDPNIADAFLENRKEVMEIFIHNR